LRRSGKTRIMLGFAPSLSISAKVWTTRGQRALHLPG
jgi:hypothetical protein